MCKKGVAYAARGVYYAISLSKQKMKDMQRIELTIEDAEIFSRLSEYDRLSYQASHDLDVTNDAFMRWGSDSIARVVKSSVNCTLKIRGYNIRDYEVV